MLIQEALSRALRRNLQSPGSMALVKATAARVFHELEYPNIFLAEVLMQPTELHPTTEEQRQKTFVQMLLIAGLESVCSHAVEFQLNEDFFSDIE